METTIRIQGMSCGHCVRAVETALKKLPETTVVKVAIGEAVIQTQAAPDMKLIRDTIEAEGYAVE